MQLNPPLAVSLHFKLYYCVSKQSTVVILFLCSSADYFVSTSCGTLQLKTRIRAKLKYCTVVTIRNKQHRCFGPLARDMAAVSRLWRKVWQTIHAHIVCASVVGWHDNYAHVEGHQSRMSGIGSGRGVQTGDYQRSIMAHRDYEYAKLKTVQLKETVLEGKERRYRWRV